MAAANLGKRLLAPVELPDHLALLVRCRVVGPCVIKRGNPPLLPVIAVSVLYRSLVDRASLPSHLPPAPSPASPAGRGSDRRWERNRSSDYFAGPGFRPRLAATLAGTTSSTGSATFFPRPKPMACASADRFAA